MCHIKGCLSILKNNKGKSVNLNKSKGKILKTYQNISKIFLKKSGCDDLYFKVSQAKFLW
jgi:hypothetical protein